MQPRLIVVSPGILSSVQDLGRFGYRRFGVPLSGALHPDLARIANALARNPETTPVLEFFLLGPTFRLESGIVRLALAGEFSVEWTRKGRRSLSSWRSITLEAGDTLRLGAVTQGKAGYVAITGGIAVPPIMGSCSTYLRGGFGGLNGQRILANTLLPLDRMVDDNSPDLYLPVPPGPHIQGDSQSGAGRTQPSLIRVIMGPQADYFTDCALRTFLKGVYTVTRESDRMGARLEGPLLLHHPEKRPEIVSDGVVPGAIQVPGNGAPIVLLADAPTVGGYPKIATIITADLPRLAVMVPGTRLRFQAVSPEEAEILLRRHRESVANAIASMKPLRRGSRNRLPVSGAGQTSGREKQC